MNGGITRHEPFPSHESPHRDAPMDDGSIWHEPHPSQEPRLHATQSTKMVQAGAAASTFQGADGKLSNEAVNITGHGPDPQRLNGPYALNKKDSSDANGINHVVRDTTCPPEDSDGRGNTRAESECRLGPASMARPGDRHRELRRIRGWPATAAARPAPTKAVVD